MMSVKFVWSDLYSVGNKIVDNQHKRLFELGNLLSKDMNAKEIKHIIMELYKYTRVHFTDEEEIMANAEFPELSNHKVYHENLISDLNKVSEKKFDNAETILEFKEFLFDWLIDHILYKDKLFAKYMQSKE